METNGRLRHSRAHFRRLPLSHFNNAAKFDENPIQLPKFNGIGLIGEKFD